MARRSYADKDGTEKRDRKQDRVAEGYDAPFRGYINVALTDEQKSSFVSWSASASPDEVLSASVSDGVHLSLRLEAGKGTYLASGTQRRSSSPNAGLVVTARAAEPGKALFRLLFTLAFLGRKETWEETQPLADPDRW